LTGEEMKINLKGIEIDLPMDAQVEVSEDGTKVKIGLPKAEVVERIRVVEVPGESVERIRIVEVEKAIPCGLNHYPTWPNHQPWHWRTTTTSGSGSDINGTSSGINIR
jgi:hypothetical protein